MRMTVVVRVLTGILLSTLLMACGSPRPQSYNLAGYSAVYKRGHADGCASNSWQQRKDERLYRGDADYMMGWNDGLGACAKPK